MTGRETLSVVDVLRQVSEAMVEAFPAPVWVKGEIIGLNRTTGGAVFLRLADSELPDASLEVMVRGRVMNDIERQLHSVGLGTLRDGIEIRARGTVSSDRRRSVVRLHLLEIDPEFTAGRLALDRAEILRKLTADGSLQANGALPVPDVPLRVGLVTSRGSAAHGDFCDQLRRSGFRFRIKTAHTTVQGETAPDRVVSALERLAGEPIDVVVLVRGGGSKLDLAAFDTERVARAISKMPYPVLTGIGHEMDRSIADEAAAVATKTPSAAGEWLVGRVADFAARLERARHSISSEARSAIDRNRRTLATATSGIAGGAISLRRQRDQLEVLRSEIASVARGQITRQRDSLESYREWFDAVGVERTLARGFALVTDGAKGKVVRSASRLSPGDPLRVRFADGTVRVTVDPE